MGENIRGTVLGAIDPLGKSDTLRDDEIARRGKEEMDRGLSVLRGTSSDRRRATNPLPPWQDGQPAGYYDGRTAYSSQPYVDNGASSEQSFS